MSLTIQGILTIILTQLLGETVSTADLEVFIQVGGLIIGSAIAWYARYRQGDIHWWGGRR